MNHLRILLCLLLLPAGLLLAQNGLVSGPMLGQVELRTAVIWAEVTPGETLTLWYWKDGSQSRFSKVEQRTDASQPFAPVKFELGGLDINTTYSYTLATGSHSRKPAAVSGSFTTKELWQYRKPVPDFSFLAGSCSYLNEAEYDRPGTPYGKDSSIFRTMAGEDAAFMVWLGDNWYLREVDYYSNWGLWYRASRDRSFPILQELLRKMPHYAIWDDHDYGPNNANKAYALKEESRKVFMNYWGNPSFGQNGQGVYTQFTYGDADFFLLDARYFRSADELADSLDGKPNAAKHMFGKEQMEWLKNALAQSNAPFKLIVTGSQVLNPMSPYDCLRHFPAEYHELMHFLDQERIEGVVFLSGDRHHSEVISHARKNGYTLYDITASPLTSGVSRPSGPEKDNPARVPETLVSEQNYAKVSVSGKRGSRVLSVVFTGIKGNKLAEWNVEEKALKYAR